MAHPLVDDNSGMSCHSSALSYLESTLHSSDNDIFIVDRRTTIHWRKRSGIGLCAVAYVLSPGAGRGETVYLSNFNRMVSGKGHTKLAVSRNKCNSQLIFLSMLITKLGIPASETSLPLGV